MVVLSGMVQLKTEASCKGRVLPRFPLDAREAAEIKMEFQDNSEPSSSQQPFDVFEYFALNAEGGSASTSKLVWTLDLTIILAAATHRDEIQALNEVIEQQLRALCEPGHTGMDSEIEASGFNPWTSIPGLMPPLPRHVGRESFPLHEPQATRLPEFCIYPSKRQSHHRSGFPSRSVSPPSSSNTGSGGRSCV
jgi:hypothetical protein